MKRVSVASIYSVGLSHMNRCMQKFLQQYPKANVRLQYQHPRWVYELVESDQVDLGLVEILESVRREARPRGAIRSKVKPKGDRRTQRPGRRERTARTPRGRGRR